MDISWMDFSQWCSHRACSVRRHLINAMRRITRSSSQIVVLLICLTERTDFLHKLELVYPKIQDYLEDMKNVHERQERPHKESAPSFIEKYIRNYMSVYNMFTTNPFLETQLQKLNTTVLYPECIVKDAGIVFSIGKEQYIKILNKFNSCWVELMWWRRRLQKLIAVAEQFKCLKVQIESPDKVNSFNNHKA